MSFQKNKLYGIRSREELVFLANEMKMDAVKNKITKSPDYSKNEAEATERVAVAVAKGATGADFLACGIIYKDNPYSLCLTVDAYDGPDELWHLSVGKVMTERPADGIIIPLRADDETVKFISEAFFDNPQEGPPEGAYQNVRHFRTTKSK